LPTKESVPRAYEIDQLHGCRRPFAKALLMLRNYEKTVAFILGDPKVWKSRLDPAPAGTLELLAVVDSCCHTGIAPIV
jgi:hypothetical protein